MKQSQGEIAVFVSENGETTVDVHLHGETVWLSQQQMQDLFQRERSVITKHINNVFKEGELSRDQVCAKFAHTAQDGKTYQVKYYNLDVIISVGYRVKSPQGTKFRIWATSVLKDHLIQGYTLNQKRLAERGVTEAGQMLGLLKNTLLSQQMITDEGRDVLDLVESYWRTWQLLWQYDEDSLPVPKKTGRTSVVLDASQARAAIRDLKQDLLAKQEATEIFGQERGGGFAGIIGTIYQTFAGQDLYPTIEDKAAHLLYFVIKDHPFVDGNKRIASFLFLLFLRMNDNSLLFDPKTMVTLTLLVASSEADQKDLLVRLVVNLLTE